MNYSETDLYLAIKHHNHAKLLDILKQLHLTKNEFFNNKITFISLAVISSKSIYMAIRLNFVVFYFKELYLFI